MWLTPKKEVFSYWAAGFSLDIAHLGLNLSFLFNFARARRQKIATFIIYGPVDATKVTSGIYNIRLNVNGQKSKFPFEFRHFLKEFRKKRILDSKTLNCR